MEEKKWKKKMATEERKAIAEDKGIALEEERIAKEKAIDERAIIFMDQRNMDATSRKYWELTRAKILQRCFGGGDGVGRGGRGGDRLGRGGGGGDGGDASDGVGLGGGGDVVHNI
jgi:hypothetical protein